MHILLQVRPASSRSLRNVLKILSRLLRRTTAPCRKEIRHTQALRIAARGQSSGDTHLAAALATPNTYPIANLATSKATADGIESGPGESKPLSEKDAPEVVTTPTSQYVENESSGDAHPVAGNRKTARRYLCHR